jgi:hypothetical protein
MKVIFLPPLRCEGLCHGNAFEETDKAHHERERDQRQKLGSDEHGERELRQSDADFTDDVHPVAVLECESGDDGRADEDHDNRPALRQRLRQGDRERFPSLENTRQQAPNYASGRTARPDYNESSATKRLVTPKAWAKRIGLGSSRVWFVPTLGLTRVVAGC